MKDKEFLEDEIDWEYLVAELMDPPLVETFLNPSPDDGPGPGTVESSSWIGGLESILMNDNDDVALDSHQQALDDFFSDILVDPIGLPTDKDSTGSDEFGNLNGEEEKIVHDSENNDDDSTNDDSNKNENENENENNNDAVADDPISKKRRRQLRNRDAAVRSRERKKVYVKDLEMKSTYMEGECRKLGRLLQCVLAENQALRFSLQKGNAYGASSAKQESAVLLLESLLLGSLLWFLGIVCLFTLPKWIQLDLEFVPLVHVEEKAPGNLAQREAGSKIFIFSVLKSRRWKASRTKMKMPSHFLKSFGMRIPSFIFWFFKSGVSQFRMAKEFKMMRIPSFIFWGSSFCCITGEVICSIYVN